MSEANKQLSRRFTDCSARAEHPSRKHRDLEMDGVTIRRGVGCPRMSGDDGRLSVEG